MSNSNKAKFIDHCQRKRISLRSRLHYTFYYSTSTYLIEIQFIYPDFNDASAKAQFHISFLFENSSMRTNIV